MRLTTSRSGVVLVAAALTSPVIWATDCGGSNPPVHRSVASRCMATTVHYVPDGGGDAALSQLPWIMAPPHAGLLGHLFYYDSRNAWKMAGLTSLHMFSGGESPDGRVSMKILWEMRHGTPSAVLKVQATKLNGPGSSFQEFESTSSDASQFPSIIDLPTPGCWRLNLKAGATMGHVVVDVVPGRRAKVP